MLKTQWETHRGDVPPPLIPHWDCGCWQDITREIGELGDTWRKEKSWSMMDPNPDSLQTGQRVGLCEKLVLVKNGGHKQEEFTKKKKDS